MDSFGGFFRKLEQRIAYEKRRGFLLVVDGSESGRILSAIGCELRVLWNRVMGLGKTEAVYDGFHLSRVGLRFCYLSLECDQTGDGSVATRIFRIVANTNCLGIS